MSASGRAGLFDLAMNRACGHAEKLGVLTGTPEARRLHDGLELWYLKTRFVHRIPLDEIIARLERCPGPGHHWSGGPQGSWKPGSPPRP